MQRPVCERPHAYALSMVPGERVCRAVPVRVVVSQEAHEIAHHRVSDPVGPGIACGVDQLVDPPRLEAVEDMDVCIRFDEGGLRTLRIEPDPALGAREGPSVARDRVARIAGIAPPRQFRPRRVE